MNGQSQPERSDSELLRVKGELAIIGGSEEPLGEPLDVTVAARPGAMGIACPGGVEISILIEGQTEWVLEVAQDGAAYLSGALAVLSGVRFDDAKR